MGVCIKCSNCCIMALFFKLHYCFIVGICMANNNNGGICSRCGGRLIVSEEFIRQTGSSLFPTTVTKFYCTNNTCQKEADDRQAEITRVRLEREEKSKNNRNKGTKKFALMSLVK